MQMHSSRSDVLKLSKLFIKRLAEQQERQQAMSESFTKRLAERQEMQQAISELFTKRWAEQQDWLAEQQERQLERLLQERTISEGLRGQLRFESVRFLQLQDNVHVRGAVELAFDRARYEMGAAAYTMGINRVMSDRVQKDEQLKQIVAVLAKRHNLMESAVKDRMVTVYGSLSKGLHSSVGSRVKLRLADTTLNHTEVVAAVSFMQRYCVYFHVEDVDGRDVTVSYIA